MENKLYVGNLPFKATEDDIKDLFSKAGEVESINIITDRQTGRSKGFCFVVMASEEAAKQAIETLNGTEFMERNINVAVAKPENKERGNTGRDNGFRQDRPGFNRQRGGFKGGRDKRDFNDRWGKSQRGM